MNLYAVAYPIEYRSYRDAGATAIFGNMKISGKFCELTSDGFETVKFRKEKGIWIRCGRQEKRHQFHTIFKEYQIEASCKDVVNCWRIAKISSLTNSSASILSILQEEQLITLSEESKKWFPKGIDFMLEDMVHAYHIALQVFEEYDKTANWDKLRSK